MNVENIMVDGKEDKVMTNAEFMVKLDAMYAKHPMIALSNPKSLNELLNKVEFQMI